MSVGVGVAVGAGLVTVAVVEPPVVPDLAAALVAVGVGVGVGVAVGVAVLYTGVLVLDVAGWSLDPCSEKMSPEISVTISPLPEDIVNVDETKSRSPVCSAPTNAWSWASVPCTLTVTGMITSPPVVALGTVGVVVAAVGEGVGLALDPSVVVVVAAGAGAV